MKMDIEGSEYTVLPHMVKHGIFCQDIVTAMTIEWHGAANHNSTLNEQKLRQQLQLQSNCKNTKIIGQDDETFLHDGKALPEGC